MVSKLANLEVYRSTHTRCTLVHLELILHRCQRSFQYCLSRPITNVSMLCCHIVCRALLYEESPSSLFYNDTSYIGRVTPVSPQWSSQQQSHRPHCSITLLKAKQAASAACYYNASHIDPGYLVTILVSKAKV